MGEMILLTEKSGFICNHLQHVYKYLVYSLLCVADSVSICNHLQPFATVINTDPQRVLRGYVADVANKMQKKFFCSERLKRIGDYPNYTVYFKKDTPFLLKDKPYLCEDIPFLFRDTPYLLMSVLKKKVIGN